jgi:hypothetical protein
MVIAVADPPTDTISRARASSAFSDEPLASGHRFLDGGSPETIVNLVFACTIAGCVPGMTSWTFFYCTSLMVTLGLCRQGAG